MPSIPLSFTQCTQYNFWWYELILLESIQTYPDCLFMFCIYLVEIFVPGEFWSYQIPSNMMCEFIWSASWYTWILIWWSYAFTHLLTLSYDVELAFRFYVNSKNCANKNTNSKMVFPVPGVFRFTLFQQHKAHSNTNPSRVHNINQIQNISLPAQHIIFTWLLHHPCPLWQEFYSNSQWKWFVKICITDTPWS